MVLQAGNASVCRQLLGGGALANCARADRGGQGPLHIASQLGHVEVVDLLLSFGAVANMPDFWGRRPLLYAVFGSGGAGAETERASVATSLTLDSMRAWLDDVLPSYRERSVKRRSAAGAASMCHELW